MSKNRFHTSLVREPEEFNAKTRKMLDRELREIKEGKNLSPVFKTAEEAIAYLKGL